MVFPGRSDTKFAGVRKQTTFPGAAFRGAWWKLAVSNIPLLLIISHPWANRCPPQYRQLQGQKPGAAPRKDSLGDAWVEISADMGGSVGMNSPEHPPQALPEQRQSVLLLSSSQHLWNSWALGLW